MTRLVVKDGESKKQTSAGRTGAEAARPTFEPAPRRGEAFCAGVAPALRGASLLFVGALARTLTKLRCGTAVQNETEPPAAKL